MKEKYYDRINKREIEINVNAKVAHFLKQERDKNRILSPEEIARLSKKKRQKDNSKQGLCLFGAMEQPCG